MWLHYRPWVALPWCNVLDRTERRARLWEEWRRRAKNKLYRSSLLSLTGGIDNYWNKSLDLTEKLEAALENNPNFG